ncbi:ATP-binding protein [Undibacterium sp. Di26W]|uniref:ATP-binding protein n=1 Tax=Undibacterium sp. Di26W TaxID=3413035 RepID=UPI003BF278D2
MANNIPPTLKPLGPLVALAGALGLALLWYFVIWLSGYAGQYPRLESATLHAALEAGGSVIAMMVAYLLLRLEAAGEGSSYNLLIATALLGMGCLDGFHSMAAAGNLFVWLHSSATAFGGLLFALILLPISARNPHLRHCPSIVLLVAVLYGGWSLVFQDLLPSMIISGKFTPAATILNVGGGLCMLLTAAKLFLTYREMRKVADLLFCLQCMLLGSAAIMFDRSSLWDLPWWMWHGLRFAGYALALWLAISTARTINNHMLCLQDTLERQVVERTHELQVSSVQLQMTLDELQQTLDHLRLTQRQLVQSEKLAALGSILSAVAHEINTPIGNCLVVASTLDNTISEFEERLMAGKLHRAQLDKYLETSHVAMELMQRGLHRAADLVTRFKLVAVNRATYQRRPFDLRKLVTELVARTQTTLGTTPYRFELDMPVELHMDSYPELIEQGLTHLIDNSLKHGFDHLDHGVIRFLAGVQGDSVRLIYGDDGCGMPAVVMDRVFDPFFTTKFGQGSNGLGMYICYNLVTGSLGGSIEVSSEPGLGTTFTLTLPLVA